MEQENQRPALIEDPLWYKDAIIYQLHVKAFFDSNDNGIGDFRGLTQRLDYIQDLGVNTLWLLPFYPSPLRDDGYDIADYRGIHPDYGSMRDFRDFVRAAHERGLRVITELVINHTSDQHPWFQAARRAPPGSSKRNYYVWSDSEKRYAGTRIIFTDTESSNWAWDPVAQQYYWHRFFSHQPDLNFENPQVLKTINRVMRFWLDAGVDGLRLDAIPYLCEREGTNNENLPETHAVLKQIRAALDERYRDRMFLAEANQWPEDVRPYFGEGDECHMAFHFPVMPRIYMAVAQEDRHPIVDIMEQTPEIPENCQWAIFLRNHDELTLEMVTDRERDYMYKFYASDSRMRLNLGIRRRLAPLMENDMDKIRLLNNLLLSLPGSPVIYYGDELGMGDNVFLGDRNGVRTPMQWSPDRNGGFSRADPARLYLPPIMDAVYGYQAVNVEAHSRDPSSLLNWMKRLIAVRKTHHAFGRGRIQFLRPGNRKVLAFVREHEDEVMLCVSNLSRAAQPVELELSAWKGAVPVELLGRTVFPPVGELPYLLTLPGHGFYWFQLTKQAEVPTWHEDKLPPPTLPVLVLFAGWRTLDPTAVTRIESTQRRIAEKQHAQFEREILPKYLAAQRWFAAKGEAVGEVKLLETVEWPAEPSDWLLTLVRARGAKATQDYFLPLSLAWEERGEDRLQPLLHRALARARRGPRTGAIIDALADERFVRAMVRACGENQERAAPSGKIVFRATRRYAELIGGDFDALALRSLGVEQSNTSVVLGDRLMVKVYRRAHEGINPELEMGRYLTEVSPFERIVPLLGFIEYQRGESPPIALALIQQFLPNQGDGWRYTIEYLEKHFDAARLDPASAKRLEEEAQRSMYLTMVKQLGLRTGQMHAALAKPTSEAAFSPESASAEDLAQWWRRVAEDVDRTLDQLDQRAAKLPERTRALAQELLGKREALRARAAGGPPKGLAALKTRYHGDYHLGQVLVAKNDFIIIDFEGEPARSLAERRAKHSPLRDVAGMLRSFNYAAYTALAHVTTDRPDDVAKVEQFAALWEHEIAGAFLAAYDGALAEAKVNLTQSEHRRSMCELFVLEKALYELRYELDNRPDWVFIPLRGILALLAPPPAPTPVEAPPARA